MLLTHIMSNTNMLFITSMGFILISIHFILIIIHFIITDYYQGYRYRYL